MVPAEQSWSGGAAESIKNPCGINNKVVTTERRTALYGEVAPSWDRASRLAQEVDLDIITVSV
jgi:hypothetical protein